jgi:hypothetical protein
MEGLIMNKFTEEDVNKVWREFWKPIVFFANNELNINQVKRELFDYKMIMEEVSKVYDCLTGGRISKINTNHNAVIDEVENRFRNLAEEKYGYLRQDDDGHWFLIPIEYISEWEELMGDIERAKPYGGEWEDLIEELDSEFGQYRLSSGVQDLKVLIEN